MFGELAGTRYDGPIQTLFDLAAEGPADTGSLRSRHLSVTQVGDVATATAAEEGYWGSVSFVDFFCLCRIDGTWKIVNKTFAHVGGEPPAQHRCGSGRRATADRRPGSCTMGTVTSGTRERLQQRFIVAVVEEGERFGVLATELAAGLTPAGAGLTTRVPWVPAWSARDLVVHLGTVHRWATAIVTAGHADGPPPDPAERPADGELLDWYAAGLATLVTTLRTTPADAPAWHMSPAAPKVAAEWARRQAHELAVHRMDLEAAAGVPHARVDPVLAEDGVDELLSIVVPRWAHTEPLRSAEALVSVRATDTGREWEVRVARGAVSVAAERAGRAGAHLEGRATDLLLRLWGRPANVRVTGDPAAEALLRGR